MDENYIMLVGALLTGLGLPALYNAAFGHLTEKKKYESSTEKEIQALKMRINQLETSMGMLLIVIKDEYDGSAGIKAAIAKVEGILKIPMVAKQFKILDKMNSETHALLELAFELVSTVCNNKTDCIYNKLIKAGVDEKTYGFWIWELQNNKEIYSPKVREVLGYDGVDDFPNIPDSWKKAILPVHLEIAMANYRSHVKTRGVNPYSQFVVYRKKDGGTLPLVCHGKIVAWEDEKPLLMIGIHLPPNGLFK